MFVLHDLPVQSWWSAVILNFYSWCCIDFEFSSHSLNIFWNILHITVSFYHQLPIVHRHDRSSPTGRTAQGMTVQSACPSRMLGTRGTHSVSVCIWPVLYFISFFPHFTYRYCVVIVLSLFIWLIFWTNKIMENIIECPRCIIKNWPVCLQLYLVGPQQASAAPLGQYLVGNQVLPASTHQARLIPVL